MNPIQINNNVRIKQRKLTDGSEGVGNMWGSIRHDSRRETLEPDPRLGLGRKQAPTITSESDDLMMSNTLKQFTDNTTTDRAKQE